MAELSIFTKSDTEISILIAYFDTSYPEKNLVFKLDGDEIDTDYISNVLQYTGIAYGPFYYTDLNPGTSYHITVEIQHFDPLDRWVTEETLSVWESTTGSGGGGDDDDDEWDYENGGTYILNNTNPEFSESIRLYEATAVRYKFTFPYSGIATFYTTGSTDTYGLLSSSSSFNYTTGLPSGGVLASDDDSGDERNFSFTYDVNSSDTYYLWVRGYDANTSGRTTVYVTESEPSYTYSHTNNSVTFSVQNRGSYYMRFLVRLYNAQEAFYDSRAVEGENVARDSYTVNGLSANTHYAINVGYATSAAASGVTWIGISDFTTGGSSLALWDWYDTNGSASPVETELAHTAITNQGKLSDFSFKVWNDLCGKVNEICTELDESWHARTGYYLPYGETLMSDRDKVLTAIRFNTLIHQFDHKGYVSTGIDEQKSGDKIYGQYFITIAECINDWIDEL